MATGNRAVRDCYWHSTFIPSRGMAWATQITTKLLQPAPGRFPDTTLRATGLGALQPRGQMGHYDTATWPLEKASSHRKPTTEGFLPVFPPELSVLIFQFEIKETLFLRPPNARIVAYPQLVKCLYEPSREEYYTCPGPLRGNLHVYLFLLGFTYLYTTGSNEGLEKSCYPL